MKFSRSDAAVSLLTLLLSCVLVTLYIEATSFTTVRSGGQPLGTIVFRKLSATRRIEGALMWERMRNNSPVYQADTLRTGNASEATICFDDGTKLDMFADSMLRLDFSGKNRAVEFLGGDISFSNAPGAQSGDLSGLSPSKGGPAAGYTVKAGDKTITVSERSNASLTRSGDSLSVQVSHGEVSVTSADGRVDTLDRTKQLDINLKSGKTTLIEQPIVLLAPEQNIQFLVERTGTARVPFSWQTDRAGVATIEVSSERDFAALLIAQPAPGGSASTEVAPGTWYWRVRAADGTLSPVRRLNLYAEPPPQPILPQPGAQVLFRKQLPEVRFAWSEMPEATAYILEVAGDKDLAKPVVRTRTASTELVVATLGEGTWYWRVTPVLSMTLLEKSAEPAARSFVIQKCDAMTPLAVTAPAAGAMFIVQEVAGKGIAFSWAPNPEAVGYEFALSGSPDISAAVLSRTSTQPWTTLSGSDAASLERPAAWYWAVRWKDAEGNLSSYSSPRKLEGIDGALAVRLTFPPQGYSIADSLIASTRFAWKCNVAAQAVYQLSENPAFSEVAWQQQSDAETLIGGQWKAGTWYWRIRTLNADGTTLHDTQPAMFRIVEPLPPPRLLTPAPGGTLHLRGEDSYAISWDPAPGADYYRFELFRLTAGGGDALQHSAVQNDTKLELPFGKYPDGGYRVIVQAFSLDKEASTRNIGYLSSNEFTFRHIARMELDAPRQDAVFEGLDARRHGVTLTWKVPDRPERSELIVSSDPEGRSVLVRRPAASGKSVIEKLGAGDYYWTVRGGLYGLDVSALQTNHFTVLAIPLLPAAGNLRPTSGTVFGPKELRSLSSIRFEWNPVPDATRYLFSLYQGTDPVPVVHRDALSEPEFTLNDFSVLDSGNYHWSVRAEAYDAHGEREQDGREVDSDLTVDVPPISAPAPNDKETFYGR